MKENPPEDSAQTEFFIQETKLQLWDQILNGKITHLEFDTEMERLDALVTHPQQDEQQ